MVKGLSFLELAGYYSFLELFVGFSFLVLVGGFGFQELLFLVRQDEAEENKEWRNSVDPSSSFEIFTNSNWLKLLLNFDI